MSPPRWASPGRARRSGVKPVADFDKASISRACASKWLNRWRRYGDAGLRDRPSTPHSSRSATPPEVVLLIEAWRREKKWTATRITHELGERGIRINRRTVTRYLTRLGIGRREFLDPDGGGWRVHGRDSEQHRAVERAKEFNHVIGKATRHQYTRAYAPRHNGKVERYNRILAEELLYARRYTSKAHRAAAVAV